MTDAKAFGEELAEIVRTATAPLAARIAALEKALADRPDPTPGRDGKDAVSVTVDDVMPALEKQVADYLSSLPPPTPGEKGRDGVGLAGALLDRDGNMIVTLTNGETKTLGRVVGEDGKDGKDGDAGRDGMGFDDLALEYDGERTLTFRMERNGVVKQQSFDLPIVLDRGVYKAGTGYVKGDAVTYGGSLWIAQCDTRAKPDATPDWRLSVKRGRDAREPSTVKVGGKDAG